MILLQDLVSKITLISECFLPEVTYAILKTVLEIRKPPKEENQYTDVSCV